MKIELEQKDIQAIASTVVEMLKPLLKQNGKGIIEDAVFDVKGLAQYLKVDTSWVYKQVSLNALPHFKCGKYIRFKKLSIDRWVDSETVKPIPPLKMVKGSR